MKPSDLLLAIAEHSPIYNINWTVGLCSNLRHFYGANAVCIAREFMASHPNYSGMYVYPLPHSPDALHGRIPLGNPNESLEQTNYHEIYMDELPDLYTGTYGRTRRDMARELAAYFASLDM